MATVIHFFGRSTLLTPTAMICFTAFSVLHPFTAIFQNDVSISECRFTFRMQFVIWNVVSIQKIAFLFQNADLVSEYCVLFSE